MKAHPTTHRLLSELPIFLPLTSYTHAKLMQLKQKGQDTMTHQRNSTAILSCCHSEEILSQFLTFWRPYRLLPFSNTYTPTESSAGRKGNFTGF